MTRASALGRATAILCVAAGCVVVLSGGGDPGRLARATEFQHVVGGLGLGPAVDLAVCEPDFDPRVGAVCSAAMAPIPGGWAFCPHRAGAALVGR